ncbi:MAG TPA: 2-C-methyl-D-erythritol 2,4-cyclodiphosphate synthase [Actinomycetota bacterium]
MTDLRVGLGFDAHPRDETRPLMLAGVRFEGEPGVAGHSDGDVVCHALADALLGAGALGDIGDHFPDDEPSTEGIAGIMLLSEAVRLVRAAGLSPQRCDLVVVAERPRIADRRDEMRANLAEVLGVDRDAVSVKATRPEGLGLVGDGLGCMAVATLSGP